MSLSPKQGLPKDRRNTGIRSGRVGRTIVALAVMLLVGLGLALLNVFTTRRDLALATGPEGADQRAWLVDAAERPDIAQFFKKMPHAQRVAMARAVARYDDAPLAKLCGILLADFDADARTALGVALKRIAAAHPEAVAEQLKQKGSFQTLGVSEALRPQGSRALPGVVAMLANGDARPAAIAYLVSSGDAAVAPLLPKLDDPVADVRLAAADALGGLRARGAVADLLRVLGKCPPGERPAYLTALSAIGDPSTETLLASILRDTTRPLAERTATTLGLGRIGTPDAIRLLWQNEASDEPTLAASAFSALAAVGPPALAVPGPSPGERVALAGAIVGPEADDVLRAGLAEPGTRLAAVVAAKGRPSLLPDFARLLPEARKDGDLAAALVAALATTPEGRSRLASFENDPGLSGFIHRAAG